MNDLQSFFAESLDQLQCDDHTRAYITGIFVSYQKAHLDLSTSSITTIYAEAKNRQAFDLFNQLGDWLFYCSVLYPEHLNNASEDYYYSIGRLSYYNCYRLINRQWKLFELLSDDFITLTYETRKLVKLNQKQKLI